MVKHKRTKEKGCQTPLQCPLNNPKASLVTKLLGRLLGGVLRIVSHRVELSTALKRDCRGP